MPKIQTAPDGSIAAQVRARLQARIRAGEYAPGDWLPSERALASEFGVHRRVVRAAVRQLTEEGWLVSRPRCRPVVAGAAPADSPARRASAASRLIALVMWHGGFEQGATAQQRIFWGMTQELALAGYHAVFLDPGGPGRDEIAGEAENGAREAACLHYARDHGFAGIVFYPYAYRSNRALIRDIAARLPLVMIDRMIPGIQTDFVGIDNYAAMREATRTLIALGHRRIAYATLVEPINTVQDRLAGYRDAMQEARLPEKVFMDDGAGGWPLFPEALALPPADRPTALLCVSDFIASALAAQVARCGLRIPEDICLIGFDNIIQMLPGGIGLTTIAQPFEEIGAAAGRAALARMQSPQRPSVHMELPARLIARASHMTNALQTSPAPNLVPNRG